MGYTNKSLEELDVMDDFLFSAIAADKEVGEDCGYMLYTVENHCVEVTDLKYEDGLKFLYFYTGGTKGGSEEIGTMLQYLQHSTVDNARDASTKEIHDYVSRVKTIPEVRQGYMSLAERFYYERKEAARETTVENILELLGDHGEIPEELKRRLNSIEDMGLLKKYLKLAAKVEGVAEFQAVLFKQNE